MVPLTPIQNPPGKTNANSSPHGVQALSSSLYGHPVHTVIISCLEGFSVFLIDSFALVFLRFIPIIQTIYDTPSFSLVTSVYSASHQAPRTHKVLNTFSWIRKKKKKTLGSFYRWTWFTDLMANPSLTNNWWADLNCFLSFWSLPSFLSLAHPHATETVCMLLARKSHPYLFLHLTA